MKMIFTLAFALLLTGCASSPWGNFAQDAAPATNRALATDAVTQMVVVFPPASTRLNMTHATPDAFGRDLLSSLRARGYSVQEFAEDGHASEVANTTNTAAPKGLSLSYVVDTPLETNLYRVTLKVGYQMLTRAYVAQNNTVQPAGAWTRKE